MGISSISSSYRTYNISYVTRGPLLVAGNEGVEKKMETAIRLYRDFTPSFLANQRPVGFSFQGARFLWFGV